MIGKRIGPYEIVEEIGKGGMATVYRAYQPNLDRFVAIKIIHRAIALDNASLERFQREARLLTRLVHPHLLPIYDYDATSDPPYIVMRYLDSGTLKDIIDKGKLPHGELIHMLRQVASALDYAHRNNVIHRDIKPSNVMLDEDGNAFLTDFGIARTIEAGQDMTQSGYALGTPGYMSPEQGMGVDGLNSRADIYSLGVLSFQMLTGKLPYTGDTPLSIIFKHISDPIPSINQFDPLLAPETNVVMARVLAKQPEDRYETATEFVDDLAKVLHVTGIATTSVLKLSVQANRDLLAAKRESQKDKIDATMHALEGSRPTPTAPKLPVTQSLPDAAQQLDPDNQQAESADLPPISKEASSRWPLIAGIVTAAAIIALVFIALRDDNSAVPTPTNTALVVVVPSAAASSVPTRPVTIITATAVKPSATATSAPSATHTPTLTPSRTPTATSTPSATPSATPTVSTPEAKALRATIVRAGPGSQYPKVADITSDMRLIIVGASEDGAWLKVLLPDQSEGWLAYNPTTFDFKGNVLGVPLALAPTDTPSYTPSATTTSTSTPTATASYTLTATATASYTPTATFTSTPSNTPTATASPIPTITVSPTGLTLTPTLLPSPTPLPPGRLPFVADFEAPNALTGWDYDPAVWQQVSEGGEGILIGQGKLTQPLVVLGRERPEWQANISGNLLISFNVNLDKQSGGARVIFRCGNLNRCQNGYNVLEILPGLMILRRNAVTPDIANRDTERPLKQVKAAIEAQQWYEIRIWVEDNRILVYLDRQLVMSVEDSNTPPLGGGAVILQTNSSFRAVRWDNIVIQRPEAASEHFEAPRLPSTWQTTSATAALILPETDNQYLRLKGEVTVKPSILPIRDLALSCRVWIEQGGYQLTIRQGANGSLRFTFASGNMVIDYLDGANSVVYSRTVNNVYNINRWDDLSISFIGDRLEVFRDGVSYFQDTILGSPASGGMSFQTGAGDIIRLDDCLITETAASSNASARFALELQAQVFSRAFREPRSDLSDAFDDKFRTDAYWLNALGAPGEFVTEDGASEHQRFLRITHDNRTTYRIIRSDLGLDLFGAGEDNRNYSDSSDYLASVAIRLPKAVGTAWMGIRATPSLGGSEINGYKLGLRRNADNSISTIVQYQDGNRNETYYEGSIPGTDNSTLPDWITLTVITYKQRIAFFVDGHFVVAIEDALTLGGTVALGVDNGTTADFDNLIIRDTTPHDG